MDKKEVVFELKPCPFCGSKAVLKHTERNEWLAECSAIGNCGGKQSAEFPLGYTYKADAVELWNKRFAISLLSQPDVNKVITFDKEALPEICKLMGVPYDPEIIGFTKKGAVTNILDLMFPSQPDDKEVREEIKKLSLKKGDVIVAHPSLAVVLSHTKLDIDFKVPIIFTDDLDKIQSHNSVGMTEE